MNEDVFSFVVYIIHACAAKWKTPPSDVYRVLKQSGCLDDYLVPYYDVLHTQSADYVAHDVETFLKDRGIEA